MATRAEKAARGVIAALIAAAVLAAPGAAHHSYAPFDRAHPVTIEGVVEQVEWVNPHVRLGVRTPEGALYEVEWLSANGLARQGERESPLAPGDQVSITGAPHRDSEQRVMSLVSEVMRPADGWRWSRRIPPAPLQEPRGPRNRP